MDFRTIAREAHETAKEKGWHDEERTPGELWALVHSEISEALEAFRKCGSATQTWHGPDGKLEGVPSELADVVIRLADMAEFWGVADNVVMQIDVNNRGRGPLGARFGEIVCGLHEHAVDSDGASWGQDYYGIWYMLDGVIGVAAHYAIDLDTAIAEKMAYNKTRPFKHGGKHL